MGPWQGKRGPLTAALDPGTGPVSHGIHTWSLSVPICRVGLKLPLPRAATGSADDAQGGNWCRLTTCWGRPLREEEAPGGACPAVPGGGGAGPGCRPVEPTPTRKPDLLSLCAQRQPWRLTAGPSLGKWTTLLPGSRRALGEVGRLTLLERWPARWTTQVLTHTCQAPRLCSTLRLHSQSPLEALIPEAQSSGPHSSYGPVHPPELPYRGLGQWRPCIPPSSNGDPHMEPRAPWPAGPGLSRAGPRASLRAPGSTAGWSREAGPRVKG